MQRMLSEYKAVTDMEKAQVVECGGLHVVSGVACKQGVGWPACGEWGDLCAGKGWLLIPSKRLEDCWLFKSIILKWGCSHSP